MTNDTEVSGSPLVVGYSVSVEYRGGAPDDAQLLAAVERTAADGSWKESAREDTPGAFTITYERDGVEAFVQVLRNRGRIGGEIDAKRQDSTQSTRRNVAAIVGALLAGCVAAVVLRLRPGRQGG